MAWSNVTITDSGVQLLSRMINGSKLTYTKVEIGSGFVANEEIASQTEISEPIRAPALISGTTESESKNGVVLQIQIRNDGITEITRMKQIGIFTKSEHDSEILFAILQDEIGEEIPAYSTFSQFCIEMGIVIAVDRTNNITAIVSPCVYVTVEQFNRIAAQSMGKAETAETTSKDDYIMIVGDNGELKKIPASGFAAADHTHKASDISGLPSSLPANGGNAETVNGHTVLSDVPANAKFTDTTYSSASASATGLVSTGTQTFAGNKTFNGQVLPNGASACDTAQARKLSSGTAAATASNCAAGCWYGQYE